MNMARITDLPNELLDPILHNLLDTSPESLAALASTCVGLNAPARAVLCQHVFLRWRVSKQSPANKFMAHNSGNQFVRSLRLHPWAGLLNAFKVRMPIAYDSVDTVCACLRTLTRLTTFSINLVGIPYESIHFPPSVIVKILESLPDSVVNLEIDTVGSDLELSSRRHSERPDIHVCDYLSKLIPRLEILRLRIGSMCPALFSSLEPSSTHQPVSRLRIGQIKLELLSDIPPHCVLDCRGSALLSDNHKYPTKILAPNTIFDKLLALQAAGAFPYAETFFLLSWKHRQYIRVRDVVTKTLTHYPVVERKYSTASEQLNLVFDHESKMYFGTPDEVEQAITYSVGWEEFGSNGTRLPITRQFCSPEGATIPKAPELATKYLMDKSEFLSTRKAHEYIRTIFEEFLEGECAVTRPYDEVQ
ncbi:hypothetical protein B0J11DRAFT_234535 [Dendryphion nanum]|uniref:F-box domain-containing protein n=1 Tax=Dendryphion nanum TaxID=256645 RepID=A0A9P9I6P7_9PLEO|nr:hypothetical protein B0J11DRAFT_234535 [Dendryphion nanum]